MPSPALLDWKYVEDKLPWGIVLLLGDFYFKQHGFLTIVENFQRYFLIGGGGFALSDASKVSGLSTWIGAQLAGLSVLPPFLIMFIICIMTATITEV